MSNEDALQHIRSFVYERFKGEPTGHDYWHMERVAKTAIEISKKEGGDPLVIELAAWLHDVADAKLVDNQEKALKEQRELLENTIHSQELAEAVIKAMKDISFSKKRVPETLEGKIVQDADRLDAIGAIGIARTFAYGGKAGQLIHTTPVDGDQSSENTTIQHFYDKLLRLKDLMNTGAAKSLAEERHAYMERFLREFYEEWNGRK